MTSEFEVLLQQASALKSQQLKSQRPRYESSPVHLKNTLFHDHASKHSDLTQCLRQAETFKSRGNELFTKGAYVEAIDQYERALGEFSYIKPLHDIRSNGIVDDKLEFVTLFAEEKLVKELQCKCLLNIATCCLKLRTDISRCNDLCTLALEIKPGCAKALYKRAQARSLQPNSGTTELEMALADARKAYELDSKDTSVRRLLRKLSTTLKNQRMQDIKTFKGVLHGKRLGYSDVKTPEDKERERELQRKRDSLLYLQLSEKFNREGRTKEAEELLTASQLLSNDHVDHTDQEQDVTTQVSDWDNPSDEMILEAENFGVDLRDRNVIAEIKRIQNGPRLDEDTHETAFTKGCILVAIGLAVASVLASAFLTSY